MHVFGIAFLFLAAVLPLSLWSITVFGFQTSAATIAVVPVLVYWFLLDFALGAAIFGAAIVLLSVAALIVSHEAKFATVTGTPCARSCAAMSSRPSEKILSTPRSR